jgi:NAD(P)-dependent dehydrogenase (short-subunit alcohol dehydrogenase family)
VDLNIRGRVALVTGGSRGIGRACALDLAAEGVHVAINYARDAGAAGEVVRLAEGAGVRSVALQADVSDEARVRRMVQEAEHALGPIDILVNNAGIQTPHWDVFAPHFMDDWDRIQAVNCRGMMYCVHAVIPGMRERGWGRIVFVNSMSAYGMGMVSAYIASKAATVELTRSLGLALAPYGINVNGVSPGNVLTDFPTPLKDMTPEEEAAFIVSIPIRRVPVPEDIAPVVVFLCSDLARNVVGEDILVTGGQRVRA